MTEAILGGALLMLVLGHSGDIHSSYHGGACIQRDTDQMEVWKVCEFAAAALVHAGHDPRHPFRWSDCPGCISKLNAVVGLLRCESGLNPRGYDEGYVAGTWNESRGIAQIGNGWDHIATDAEAYSWKWSVAWLIEDLRRLTTRWYPECGR